MGLDEMRREEGEQKKKREVERSTKIINYK
jgi:hypothetical protein